MLTRSLATLTIIALLALTSTVNANRTSTHSIDSFSESYINQSKPRAAILYLLKEYRNKNYSDVTEFSRLLIKSGKLTAREKAETYQLLALAERKRNNPEKERRAWMQFYNLTFSSDALLRVVKLHHQAGRYTRGLRIANRVQLERLSKTGQIKWYRVIGTLYHDSRQLNNALFIRERLVELLPNAENSFHYSETLFALGKKEKAYAAIKRALKDNPDNPAYLLNQAYILSANGDIERANEIIKNLSSDKLKLAQIKVHNGQHHLKNGSTKLANKDFKLALRHLNKQSNGAKSSLLNQHIIDLSQLSIQSELKNLENKFTFSISNSICRDDNGCNTYLGSSTTNSAPALGSLHALYQLNKKVSVAAGLIYKHENNRLSLNTQSGIASIGLNIQPMRKNNLQISLERQFGIGDLALNNTKLTLSIKHTKGNKIKPSATREKSWPYLHLYAEVSKLLEQQKDNFVFLEGRYGRTIKLNNHTALSPYLFGVGNHHSDDNNSDNKSTEAGIGVALNIDHFLDKFKGSRGHTELFFKAGRDLYVSENDEEFRTRLGIEFSYQ